MWQVLMLDTDALIMRNIDHLFERSVRWAVAAR